MIKLIILCFSLLGASPAMAQDQVPAALNKNQAQKAKDMIATAMSSQNISGRARTSYLEEVIPFAAYFLDGYGNVSVPLVNNYLKFSSELFTPQTDEEVERVAVCTQIIADGNCQECTNIKADIEQRLTALFKKRGFQVRPLSVLTDAAAQENYSADYATPEAFDRVSLQAAEGGCVNVFYVGVVQGDRGAVKASFFADFKDKSKRRHKASYQLSELPHVGYKPTFTTAEAVFAKGTAQVLSEVYSLYSAATKPMASQGPERILVIERVKNFQDYVLFKKKLLDRITGLRGLDERKMGQGTVEFAVNGDISLDELNRRLLTAIGPEPVIESHGLESAERLKVVFK